MGETIFKGRTGEVLPNIIKGGIYPEDVVIFSMDRELFSSTTMNIGEVIDFIIREQERIEVEEKEIIDWVTNKPDQIFKKCPCVVIMPNGHLEPLIQRNE